MPKEKVFRLDQGIIDAIENVLADARRGIVRSVAIATVGQNYNSGYAWSFGASGDSTKLIGAVEVLKARILLDALGVEYDEGEPEPPDGNHSA